MQMHCTGNSPIYSRVNTIINMLRTQLSRFPQGWYFLCSTPHTYIQTEATPALYIYTRIFWPFQLMDGTRLHFICCVYIYIYLWKTPLQIAKDQPCSIHQTNKSPTIPDRLSQFVPYLLLPWNTETFGINFAFVSACPRRMRVIGSCCSDGLIKLGKQRGSFSLHMPKLCLEKEEFG